VIIGIGNPNKYTATDVNKKLNKTYEEIWKKDENRIKLINEEHAIDVKIIWEADAYNDEIINELITWVYTKNE
jgi:hypothetical protein